MPMITQLKQCLYAFVLFSLVNFSTVTAQTTGQIDVITEDLKANDIVYDQHRDVIYATVGSSAGAPNGNSIVVLDPATLNVLDRIFVGSEPNKLAISNDCSRVYVGIDGATSVRYYEPGTGLVGPLYPVLSASGDDGSPAIVDDIVVSPTDPSVIVVSANEVSSSGSGNIVIFDDTGRIGGIDYAYGPNSLAFIDDDTLVGHSSQTSGFYSTLYKFDNNELTTELVARQVISGFGITVEVSGGLIFSTGGHVVDASNLTSLGVFQDASGAVEANVEDGLVYYLEDSSLTVFDTTTFLQVDSYPINFVGDARTLDFVGEDRLAFVAEDGTVGVASGVKPAPTPPPVINLAGTAGDDELLFDLGNREFTLNGTTTSVHPVVNKFRFNGLSGQDSVRFIGDRSDSQFAVLRSNFFSVAAQDFSFSARNCNDVEFVSKSEDDTAVFYDSVDQDDVVVTPGRIVLTNNLAKLVTTSVARGFVYSQGGDDNISFGGRKQAGRLAVNLKQRRIAFSNQFFFVNSRGFLNAQVNSRISNNDSGSVIDSSGDDYYYGVGDFGHLFNDSGIAYSFKGIEHLNIRSTSGKDIAALQQTADSNVRGNSVWSSMFGPGFNHSLFNFGRVNVREE